MRNFYHLVLALLILATSCKNEKPQEVSQDVPDSEISTEENFLTLYTHRHYDSDKAIFQQFEDETGIEVRVVQASADELIQKMANEGEQSPADLLLTVDAGRLTNAKEKGLLQSISSETLSSLIPSHLQDPDKQWFGLTKRARIIVYDKERVSEEELSTYEDLASDKWKNKILIRASDNIYNQSLMASLIAHNGDEATTNWATNVVLNFARSPQGNDRDQVKAIRAGEGDIAVINTYYLGLLLNSDIPEEVEAGQSVKIYFPNQEGRGAHINISGIGVSKHAPNKENAVKFIEYLLRKDVQETFASTSYEYPVNPNAEWSAQLKDWGTFKEDELPLNKLGELNKEAVMLFDKVNWP